MPGKSGGAKDEAKGKGKGKPKSEVKTKGEASEKAAAKRASRSRAARPTESEEPAQAAPADTPRPESLDSHETEPALPAFKIAGIGASAGGLEALREVLGSLPERANLAIVVVQHLAPSEDSMLPRILGSDCAMPVLPAATDQAIEAGTVYVNPPGVELEIERGVFRLRPRPRSGRQLPIDVMLTSMARWAESQAIAVIVSGTGSDGALGVREIKGTGGIVIAQTPASAAYDGMPRAAIATGAVDLILEPTAIAHELVRLSGLSSGEGAKPALSGEDLQVSERELASLYPLLRTATGVDFTHYRVPTIRRRLQRRMVLHRIHRMADYVRMLRQHPDEIQRLSQDLLIHVTRFFRDPDSFRVLRETAYPRLLADVSPDATLRIWVAGSSTGEEAYSVAISLIEFLEELSTQRRVQIFATDISEGTIDLARAGIYPENIEADVSAVRLRRFFTKIDGGYRISQSLREMCVFARQDISRDPPFSKLDLILCRNVLIYLNPVLQRQLMSLFHYALKPSGFLALGAVETVGPSSDLFAIADKRHKLYTRKHADLPPTRVDFKLRLPEPMAAAERTRAVVAPDTLLQQRANRLLVDRYAPAAVVVNDQLDIVYARGPTSQYLELPEGTASLNAIKMARDGLGYALRSAVQGARKRHAGVMHRDLQVRRGEDYHGVQLELMPIREQDLGPHFLIAFSENTPTAAPVEADGRARRREASRTRSKATNAQISELKRDLENTRAHMQAVIQDLEAANEELQSANEEILSSNEELQSTNGELDTAREELQSTNEEINTVNEELHARNEELIRANSDMNNCLAGAEIAIVIVGADLRIRRFTPTAERVLNLIATDVGRPIGHIQPNIDCPELEQRILDVVESVAPWERQVRDRQGNWYSLRIRPYKNLDHRIDGAVLALFDIDASVRDARLLEEHRALLGALLQLVSVPVLILDEQLRVTHLNRAFAEVFRIPAEEAQGESVFAMASAAWDVAELRELLQEWLRGGARSVARFRVPLRGDGMRGEGMRGDGMRGVSVSARRSGAADAPSFSVVLQVMLTDDPA